MSTKVTMTWVKGMVFDAVVNGHHILMDADPQWGGQDTGPRPKPLILAAISGCTGMDVVSILEKMHVTGYTFSIDMEAESTTEHPIIYHTIYVKYFFQGNDLPSDKIIKAVKLSSEQYCGVSAMISKSSTMVFKVYINGTEVM